MAKRKHNKRTASELLFYQYFNCVQVSIMKLGEIDRKIQAIIVEGGDIDSKMKELVETYREPVRV
jgi:hypothetical protein